VPARQIPTGHGAGVEIVDLVLDLLRKRPKTPRLGDALLLAQLVDLVVGGADAIRVKTGHHIGFAERCRNTVLDVDSR
jgi:hypothetical protein